MEKKINQKLPETGKGNYEVEKPENNNQNSEENNDVGAPPLVIVVQGGRGVKN